MQELWAEITGFPPYVVSSLGHVDNAQTGRRLARTVNRTGVVMVTLFRERRHYTRSVAVLVATHFLPEPSTTRYDTLIHLDGDRTNNSFDNLMWRTRATALAYHNQFVRPWRYHITNPILLVEQDVVFPDSWTAAKTLGVLERDIVLSVRNSDRHKVFIHPHFYTFMELNTNRYEKRAL